MRYFFWALTTILLAGACASSDAPQTNPGDGCAINSDCSTPLVCAFRKCHMACLDTRDCPTNQRCMASDRPFHVCQLPTETKCGYNSDCPEGQICAVDGQCRDQCTSDRDCVSHQICTARSCAEVVELDAGALTPVAVPEDSGAPSNGLALPVHLGLSHQPDLPFVWVVRTRMRDVPRLCGGLRLPGGRLRNSKAESRVPEGPRVLGGGSAEDGSVTPGPDAAVGGTCANMVKDGTETDVDCGGGSLPTVRHRWRVHRSERLRERQVRRARLPDADVLGHDQERIRDRGRLRRHV